MNSRQPQPWIGFFDLLGTKDSAKARQGDFPSKIDRFGRTLAQQASATTSSTQLRFFADSAYIQCADAADLLGYARRVRKILFGEEIFFKCAIGPGTLDEQIFDSASLRLKSSSHVDIRGTTFGPSVTNLYYLQEEYKGVGIRVVAQASDAKSVSQELVDSCFPRDDDLRQWITYKDIAYTVEEIGEPFDQDEELNPTNEEAVAFLDNLLVAALRANANKKNLSRYYMSTLITAIASSDFSSIEHSGSKWRSAPPVFHHLFVSRKTRQNYLGLAGAESLYFHAASRILSIPAKKGRPPRYEDNQQAEVCNAIVAALMRFKVLTGTLKAFPAAILDYHVRDNIVRRAVALKMNGGE